MKTMIKIFLCKYGYFVKYLAVNQVAYLEQMCTRLFNHIEMIVDNITINLY